MFTGTIVYPFNILEKDAEFIITRILKSTSQES